METIIHKGEKYYYSKIGEEIKIYDESFIEVPQYIFNELKKRIEILPSQTPPQSEKYIKKSLNVCFGSNAKSIYLDCCERFGWDREYAGYFVYGKYMFAAFATPEDYDVWFIAHNNFTGTQGGKWKNIYCGDIIKEYWYDINDISFTLNNRKRVCFIKKDGVYYFIGVFAVKKIDGDYRIYELVSDVYPIKEE